MILPNKEVRIRRRARFPRRVIVLVVVAAAGVALVAFSRGWLSALFFTATGPVFQARYSLEGTASTTALIADREALYAENLDLKSRLGRSDSHDTILAGVLLRPPATPYDTLVLDAGSAEGVALRDRVSAGGTLVVGVVTEVYAHASRATLYSAPGESYDALLEHKNGGGGITPITLKGGGGGSLSGSLPAGSDVFVGDHAVAVGVAGGLLGRVAGIGQEEGEAFVTVYVQVPVDLFSLRYVEIWKETTHDTR